MDAPSVTVEELDFLLDEEDRLKLDRGTLVSWMDLAWNLYHDEEWGTDARAIGINGDPAKLVEKLADTASEEVERPIIDGSAKVVIGTPNLLDHLRRILTRYPDTDSPGESLDDEFTVKLESLPHWLDRWLEINGDSVGMSGSEFLSANVSSFVQTLPAAQEGEKEELEAVDRRLRRARRLMRDRGRRGLDAASRELQRAKIELANRDFDLNASRTVLQVMTRKDRNYDIMKDLYVRSLRAWQAKVEEQEKDEN